MKTLHAHRQNNITTLKDSEGKTKAVFPNTITQPRKGTKTIVINCWKYLIDWTNVSDSRSKRMYSKQK